MPFEPWITTSAMLGDTLTVCWLAAQQLKEEMAERLLSLPADEVDDTKLR